MPPAPRLFLPRLPARARPWCRWPARGVLRAARARSLAQWLREFRRLGMDFVIFQTLGANRLEGSESDVERDLGDFDIARADALQNFWREVQTRGRRGHGTSLPGVDGLIALAIGGLVGALDVRRQRECGRGGPALRENRFWKRSAERAGQIRRGFRRRASSSPSPKIIFSPTGIFLPGRTSVSQVSGASWRTSSTSIGACRCSWRAGIVRAGGFGVDSRATAE